MNAEVQNLALDAFKEGIYKKNINYIFNPKADAKEFEMAKSLGGSPSMCAWIIQQSHYRVGVQMQVSKTVTDDLISTDFSKASKIEDVPWPSEVVELYFEDPFLPSLLVMKTTPEKLQARFPQIKVGLKSDEYITALMQEGSGYSGQLLSLQLKQDMYDTFLASGECEEMDTALFSSNLSHKDNCAMSYMLHLALKVFVFASIPYFKPKSVNRKQMSFGGKPGIKGRPERPAFHVAYLPKIVTEKPKSEETKPNTHRDFYGRRGHLHWYLSERFVNRKGTWDWLPPIKNPHTGKYPELKIIKVRKPVITECDKMTNKS